MNQNTPHHADERMVTERKHSHVSRSYLPFVWEGCWVVSHFACCFLLQIAELFAPFFLIVGIGWSLVPHIIGLASESMDAATHDPQTRNLIDHITHSFPTQLTFSGHVFTPHSLIVDGFFLMALAAAAATLSTWIGRRL
ncbi:hypothetical protein GS501_06835 [Saccharibacter sp. 17.LH.SD]|uniref:hypothetical protein n=1 Tax=Saccharibacter sp. 17.LH.SD TaxID=2689393 RepID=UPI00136A3BEA|nr:hypothetical protein [Saccharibacter sp. 17.LH.SD]MXV44750.1 hypothetical protein [Saccharibacter sp. 17.LH.SD]